MIAERVQQGGLAKMHQDAPPGDAEPGAQAAQRRNRVGRGLAVSHRRQRGCLKRAHRQPFRTPVQNLAQHGVGVLVPFKADQCLGQAHLVEFRRGGIQREAAAKMAERILILAALSTAA